MKGFLKDVLFGLIVVFVIAFGFGFGLVGADKLFSEDPEEMQRKFDAYRLCMQSAGTNRCQMTPQDFIRYYELKYQLESENE